MADYQITIQATCTGLDAIEAQLNRILSKNGPIELTANISGLDKQIKQVQNGMVSSGKTVGANFSKGFNSGLKAVKAPTLKETVNSIKKNAKEISKAASDAIKIDPSLDEKTAQKIANQYVKAQESASRKIADQQQKALQKQADTVAKIQKEASTGKLDAITSGLEKDIRKLGNIAPDRISSLKESLERVNALRQEIKSGKTFDGNDLLGDDLIKKKQQFDDYASSIKNSIKTLNDEFSGLDKPLDRLDAISASNKTLKWLKNNSKAAKAYGEVLEDLAAKQRVATTQGELKNLNRQVSAIQSKAALEGKTGSSFGEQLINDVKRLGSAFSAFGIIDNLVSDIPYQMYQAVAKVDDAMTNLKMATGVSNDEALQLMDTYSAMGDRLKATSTDVAASSVEWLKQGKSISEANALTEDSIILSKIGDLSSQDATKTITAAMKAYSLSTDEVMGFVDQISAIDMVSATDVGGLATAFNEVAANAKQAGISTEELLSYAAVIGETTQEGMASVGTSLNAVFSRMGNIKLSRLKDYETGEDLSNVETVLRGIGIQTRESNDEFRDFDEILDDIGSRYNEFSGVQQRAIAQALAGTNHMNEIMVLLQNYSKAQEYAELATNASGQSMEKYAAYTESLAGKMEGFKNSFQGFSTSVLSSDFLGGIIDSGGEALDVVSKLIDRFGMLGVLGGGYGLFKGIKGQGKLYCCCRKRALVA